jgi:hypothetical protein
VLMACAFSGAKRLHARKTRNSKTMLQRGIES